jgi:rare lipoprotein A
MASYYGKSFHGRKTARWERFSQIEMTAAHSPPPLGTTVMVENCETGEQVEVSMTNRRPSVHKNRRVIDLSKAVADNRGRPE